MTKPRTHKTKTQAKPKVAAKKQQRATLEKSQKKCGRSPPSDSDKDSPNATGEGSDDKDSEPVAKKARKTKGNSNEVEIVDDDVDPPEEDIENVSADDVSTCNYNTFMYT
jgi:hypothetical protein